MPTENTNDESVVDTKTTETQQPEPKQEEQKQPEMTLDEAIKRIAKLEGINKEVIGDRDNIKGRLREFEAKEAEKEEQLLTEQGQYKELLEKEKQRSEQLESQIRGREVDSVIKAKLRDTGLSDDALKTALALVDKSNISYDLEKGVDEQAVVDSINALKSDHSVLFATKPKTPDVKRAADRSEPSTYLSELKALREKGGSRKELDALRAKYNR